MFSTTRFVKVITFLLILNVLTGNISPFSRELNSLIALGLVAAFVLMYFPVKVTRTKQNVLAFGIFALSAFAFIHGGIYKLFATTFFIFALDLLLRAGGRKEPELHILLLTTIFYSLFSLFYQYVPQVWFAFQGASAFLSIATGALVRQKISWGATYLGLRITVTFLFLYVSIFLLSSHKKVLLFALSLISPVIATIIYGIPQFYISMASGRISRELFIKSLDLQILLFLLCLPWTYLLLRRVSLYDTWLWAKGRRVTYLISTATLLFLSVGCLTFFLPPVSHTGSILFYDKGYLNWNVPVFGQYGGRSGGMFGLLPEYLEAKGYEVRRSDVTQESLRGIDALVVINLSRPFSKEQKQLIWDFVENGGSLMVLGDHTGTQQIREPSNDLLEPVNIGLKFDSAIGLTGEWDHAFELRPHFITKHIRRDHDTQIRIGASLAISPSARPVIIGRNGFSDPGDIRAVERGYLGDMQYSQGEHLGDLVLVAENHYGKGKVLVFGDTTSFQNGVLVQSYQFVDQVFHWLTTPAKRVYPYNIYSSLILLLPALIFLIIQRRDSAAVIVCSAALCVSLLLTTTVIPGLRIEEKGDDINAEIAYIDASHLERYSMDSWNASGFGGLSYNLMRNKYLPLILQNFSREKILASHLLVIIAPAKSFSGEEIEALEEFVRGGGVLVLSVGWEERAASQSLLRSFGLEIGNTPLGRVDPSQNSQKLAFHKAWPVELLQEGAEVLCQVWDHPLIVSKSYHKGRVLLIGDSSFLLNENLEGLYNHSLPNIMFLKKILDEKFREEV